MGVVRKRVGLAFFGCSIMTSSPQQRARIVAQSLVAFSHSGEQHINETTRIKTAFWQQLEYNAS